MQGVFLLSPALADPTLEQIALYRSLEQLFRNRNHDPVEVLSVPGSEYVAQMTGISMPSLGKKAVNAFLAAKSFFFWKSVTLTGRFQGL